MTWGEALRLVGVLRRDPSSEVAAALEKWEHPITRAELLLADLFDLEHTVNSKKKPKPHPARPWRDRGAEQRMGNTGGRSPAEVRDILSRARCGI